MHPAASLGGTLSYCLHEGDGHNCLLATARVSAHVLATSGTKARLVVAFPAGNAGAAFWARSADGKALRLTIVEPPLPLHDGRLAGVRCTVQSSGALVLDKLLAGSVRTLRDYQHAGDLRAFESAVARAADALDKLPAAARMQLPAGLDGPTLRARASNRIETSSGPPAVLTAAHSSLDGKQTVRLRIEGGRWDETTRTLSAAAYPARFVVTALSSYPPLPPQPTSQLLTPAVAAHLRGLPAARAARPSHAVRSLGFLATQRKYLAGSWRFLTYFGRDTMMSVWLLAPALEPSAIAIGLQSVLDRLSPTGRVAHEESVGNQGNLERLERFTALLGAGQQEAALAELSRLDVAVHDYKMVDDDFMLALLLQVYLADHRVRAEDVARWCAARTSRGGSNLAAVARNLEFVLTAVEPFARSGTVKDLIALQPGQQVGDWRDSNEGLGGGRYAASVNLYLVPAALAALAKLLGPGKLPTGALAKAARRAKLPRLAAAARDPQIVERLRARWRRAAALFRVTLDTQQLRQRLAAFLGSDAVSKKERALLEAVDVGDGVTVRAFVAGQGTPRLLKDGRFGFDALALDAQGRKREVLQSDDGFALLAADMSLAELDRLLRKYELPYPLGLIDDQAGVYVASPTLSPQVADYRTFDRGHYHGTVVWAWQLGLLGRGLLRQLRQLRAGRGSASRALAGRVQAVVVRLARAEAKVGALAGSELWTVEVTDQGFRAVAYGPAAGHSTESNALQLWSTVNIAVDLERSALGL